MYSGAGTRAAKARGQIDALVGDWTAILGQMQPGRLLHEASASQVAGEVCRQLQLHGPCPCPRGPARPIAARDGRISSSPAPREGDSLGRPGLKIIPPRWCAAAAAPSPTPQQTCMRPIERPAWCDGHFQGPVFEIDAGGYELQARVINVREAVDVAITRLDEVPLKKKGPRAK